MSLTAIAALIAAVSFAVLAGAGVYLAVRFTRLLGDAATLVRDTRSDQQALFARANTAVDRANAQLDLTEAATASVGELGTAMTELAGQASALAGVGRTVAGAVVGGPLGRAAAVAYGVRHAVGVRTGARQRRPLAGQVVDRPRTARRPAAAATSTTAAAGSSRDGHGAGPGRRDDPPRVLARGRGDRRDHGLPAGRLARPPAVGHAVAGRPARRRRATRRPADAPGQTRAALSRKARRGLVRGTIRFSRDARMFSRDVREGMDLYLVRHRTQGSPTLGAGARSRRSPAPPPLHELSEVPGAPTANDERVKDDR